MPYFIDQHPDCEGNWAVVKDDGSLLNCHQTKQDAIDQMVAVSIAEGIEPGGSYQRAQPDELAVGDFVRWRSSGGIARGQIKRIERDGTINIPDSEFTVEGTEEDPAALIQIYREGADGWEGTETLVGHRFSTLTKIENLRSLESREINLTPPAYMRAAARLGLRYYEEGKGGDGLVAKTIREARAMAAGSVTADKWVRMRAWIARHMGDLDAPDADPSSDAYPSAGVVAHLLWGSGPSKRAAQRAYDYADRVVTRLEEESKDSARGQVFMKMETRVWQNDFEVREDAEGMRLTGYAARFNEWSEPLPFRERIQPGAFKRSLDSRNDIKLLWNHDSSKVLGSTRAKTLKLEERADGLWVEAILPDTSYGRDAKVSIQRGDVTGFSFGFSVPAGGDSWNEDGTERTLKSVRLIEVSTGVAFPAYPTTNGTAQVRGLEHVASRAYVDADDLADAIVLMEAGGTLPTEAANILRKVIDALAEEEEMEEEEPTVGEIVSDATETNATAEQPVGDISVLELVKKKLYLLERN